MEAIYVEKDSWIVLCPPVCMTWMGIEICIRHTALAAWMMLICMQNIIIRLGKALMKTLFGMKSHFLLPIHDFRENGSTCITLRQTVRHTFVSTIT